MYWYWCICTKEESDELGSTASELLVYFICYCYIMICSSSGDFGKIRLDFELNLGSQLIPEKIRAPAPLNIW